MKIIILTDSQYRSLSLMIRCGWADGDFKGYGGERPSTQLKAMEAFRNPINNKRELSNYFKSKSHKETK